jgi:hypothetical protein
LSPKELRLLGGCHGFLREQDPVMKKGKKESVHQKPYEMIVFHAVLGP